MEVGRRGKEQNRMTNFPIKKNDIKLAMLGMTEGNGHQYSWSIIINGKYNASALAKCPYAAIIDYISKEPENNLGIENAEVTHVWTDDPQDAKHVSEVAEIKNVVSDPKDVIGKVDAVLVATDIGSEHVKRCQPFIDADIPIFVDKPLCDNLTDLKVFQNWIDQGKNFISSSAMRYCKEYEPYHQSTDELGDLRYVNVTMAKSWEKYGIHALETVYPIVGPGFESIQNIGDKDRNIVHLKHSKGIDINIANINDMLGGFGLLSLIGTKSGIQIKSTDTYYAFKKQLLTYVEYLKTGFKPVPWNETYELMQLVSVGIESRNKGGIKVNLNEVN